MIDELRLGYEFERSDARRYSREAEIIVAILREMLTVRDVALELRCSVAHVYNVINGKVKNVPRLPIIAIGRRKKLIQRAPWRNGKGVTSTATTMS